MAPVTCWCETLCAWSWVRPVRWPDDRKERPKPPGFATVDDYELVCEVPVPGIARPEQLPLPPGGRRLPHGTLWHAFLARHLCVLPSEVETWCANPSTMGKARSRQVASMTGLALALLRPAAPSGVPGDAA